jgi:uncharacterized protein (TIGR02598 family)
MKRKSKEAFSLVEVTLAIGVFAFCIVSIIGLISLEMTENQASATDTAMASMTEYVSDYLRQQSFQVLSTNYPASDTTPTSPNFCFDAYGRVILNSSGQPDTTGLLANSVYCCTIIANPSSLSTNLYQIQLDIRWPLPSALDRSAPNRIVNLTIANYE